jgi:aminomethyltransferase
MSSASESNSQTDPLRRTPLHAFHARHGARFVPFGGWEMPVQFRGILDEHRAVRASAGLFDVSHMGEIVVRGPKAGECLDYLLTNRIAAQPAGKAIYSPLCYPDGGAVDDLLVYKHSPTDFLLCVNASNAAKDLAWIEEQAGRFDCEVVDASDDYALLALQGPHASRILQRLAALPLETLKPFTFIETKLDGAPVTISRTGYTGEDGFEIFLPPDNAESLAESLLEAGARDRLQLAGLGARDGLRLEAGFALYGHELSEMIGPIQAGLGWTVAFEKPSFIGRAALLEQKQNGVEKKVVFFRTGSRRIVRAGTPVFAGDAEAGIVLSGTLSPMLDEAIGSALVATVAIRGPLEADLRGKRQPLTLVRPPIYRRPKTVSSDQT